MGVRDIFHISISTMAAHKKRSFLTMLGLIIGVTAVVLVMSIGAGAQSLITGQVQKRGTDMIGILPGSSDEKGPPASAFGIVITTLTDEDRKALLDKDNVRHAESGASYTKGNDVLSWKNSERNVTFTGTTASYKEVERIAMRLGRFFDEEEVESREHVMVLGHKLAEDIFGNQNPIGESVKLKKKRFRIIGVMAQKGSDIFENPDNDALIPITAAQRDLLGIKHVSFIRMRVDDEKYIQQTKEEVKQVLQERHGDDDFSVRTTADLLEVLVVITNALRYFLAAIAAVSMFVGGVGIMNIMLISVKEKTKEVGLRKAVGATNKDILLQFLFSTIIMSVTGGLAGIIIGIVVSYFIFLILNYLGYDYDFIISIQSVAAAFFVSGLIGVVFGTIPARRAAKLNPIEALRYE